MVRRAIHASWVSSQDCPGLLGRLKKAARNEKPPGLGRFGWGYANAGE